MNCTKSLFLSILFALTLFSGLLSAQTLEEYNKRRYEIGGWVGAANPMPGTPSARILETTLGGGFYARMPWPWIFYTELGGSYAVFLSRSERALTAMPLYAALAYKLPLELPIQFFVKGGGGSSYVVARPADTARWNPTAFGGLEASFIAGRRIRIGVRLDYYKIFETQMDVPNQYRFPLASPYDDPRLQNPANYTLQNVDFFYFGLTVGVLF
ncbi:hypothetical protein LEP1GSC202_1657 [Leptospira yanagawae serovar Saopaulo str. Sao Paulo = ATCC 700523]|uniref:Outer membrane protein beta-barrel domain-containing protein n=2 Tax=Leptospira yanagawae TaxID=293069 RepID=A0ABY2M5Q2_9LEPT|nr:hypothetical protein [Leptospira yanagawae]EOQ89879.1 hypothetical protein LEP1GSC202_1657 [Leptospira yanagawae serovar Saopaulo str. Sao Paulo = ATCC 700523]TGL24551.1 hypothetical protein EHQ46_05445 [Leptospira yanagawae]